MRLMLVLVAGLLVGGGAAAAAPLRFAGTGAGAEINVDIEGGSYPDRRVTLASSYSVDFEIDPARSTIYFRRVEVVVEPFTSIHTQSFLLPGSLTDLRTIKTTLNFDRITAVAADVGPLALTSNLGTQFEIEEYRGNDRGGSSRRPSPATT